MAKVYTIIVVLAVMVSFCSQSAHASKKAVSSKKVVSAISATVRTNKVGQKVDLSKAPAYKAAVADFMNHKYGPALTEFQQVDQNGFCCDMVHYYIAQCYDYLNQVEPAELNYSWVVAYSQDPSLKSYATYGYQKLSYYNAHRTGGVVSAVPKPPAQGFG